MAWWRAEEAYRVLPCFGLAFAFSGVRKGRLEKAEMEKREKRGGGEVGKRQRQRQAGFQRAGEGGLDLRKKREVTGLSFWLRSLVHLPGSAAGQGSGPRHQGTGGPSIPLGGLF